MTGPQPVAAGSSERFDYAVVGLGALGSATAMELARRGYRVLGLERFELGHSRGASHDTSRILRHSYHTPEYVRLTLEAYADWDRLERDSGHSLLTTVGGLDLFPPAAAIRPDEYLESLDTVGIAYERLDSREVNERWPQFRLPEGTLALHQPDAAIVPAAAGTAVMQDEARRHGAQLRDRTPVTGLADDGGTVQVTTTDGTVTVSGVIVCADAWTNQVLAPLGVQVPLKVTLEQVTYLRPDEPERFAVGRHPLWIWMDDPSYYGFPCYGEPTVKAAQDCGGPPVDPDDRGSAADRDMEWRLVEHVNRTLPGSGTPVRSLRCQYTLTPDRDFLLAPVPAHPAVVVGLGAAHGFKFAPTLGRLLAGLVLGEPAPVDLTPFRFDRPAITRPDYAAHWLV
jgi:sarcosine oxidase